MRVASRSRAGDWPLVGRGDELQAVIGLIRGSDAGGVVLAGEAGVGKSRVAAEALRRAEERGFATARAVATTAAAAIPLGALAPLLPVVKARPERHIDFVQQAVDGLHDLGGGGRLVLLVDDAHLLDEVSATVLFHLLTARGAFVMTTTRTGEPAPDAIVALWREGLAERIEIGRLERADIEALMAGALGGRVDGSALRDFVDASAGNPLVLRELVLGALEVGLLREESGLWRLAEHLVVPPALAELIDARLADVSAEERVALEILAVGEPLGLATWLEIAGHDAADGCERRGLVTVTSDRQRRVARLAHPLYGDVVRTGMTALRTMAVNRTLADAVEGSGASRRDDALRVAVWRLEGGGASRPELMVEAARQARFGYQDDLAERLARAALDAGGGIDAAVLLGEVLGDLGRHADADRLLAHTEPSAATDEQRALVAMKRADALYWGLDCEDDARSVLLAAESKIDDAAWREELACVRATYLLLGGRPHDAVAAVEPLLDRSGGRPFVESAIAAAPALAIAGRTEAAVDLADRAFAARIELGDQAVMSDPGIHVVSRVLALGEAGRLEEAAATATTAYDAALTSRQATGQAWFALMRGRIGLLQGDLASAIHHFLEGAAVFTDLDQPGPRRWCQASVVQAAAYAGDTSTADAALKALDGLAPTGMLMMEPEVDRARAWHAVLHDDIAAGHRALEAAASRARESGAYALEAGALHDLSRTGRPEAAADRLAELAGVVDGPLTAARARHASVLVADDAAGLDRCANDFVELGALLLAAEAAAAAAASHRGAGASRRAHQSTRHAATLGQRLGGSARTPALALAGPAGELTKREREVTALAAAGRTNAAIAGQLVLSIRTVESHLQRAYEKLGVTSRDELARTLDVDAEPAVLSTDY